MKYNLINILGVLILMTSCVEENFRHELIPGEGEVDFTASVGNDATTKTFYGGINTTTGNEKVYWVHDDQITVFGAGCGNRAQANYKVSVNTTDADGNVTKPQQTYANELNKAGDYGVQWGDVAKTDFYAVYPSTSNNFTAQSTESTTDGIKVVTTTSATVKTTVNPVQAVDFYRSTDGWKGIHYGSDVHNPSAPNAVMYACTKGAEAVDAEGNPKEVDLRFYPFSTVFRFTFAGFNITFEGDANATYKTMVYVNKITLTAPNNINIAGDFNLTITPAATATETNPNPRPTATAGNGSTNTITITPSTPIALETDQTVEFDVFTIPQEYTLGVSEQDPWKVTLETSGGNFTYNLIPKKVTGTDEDGNPTFANTTAKLEPGKIHNLSIPIKTIVKPEVQIPDDSWIAYIPRNVYLSELSVPGAWYSTSEVYQGNIGFKSDITATINNTTVTVDKGLKTLYDAGVRAFHIDCRLTYKSGRSGDMDLYCAGTEESSLGSITSAGTLVSDALLDIASLIKDDEYVVVVLTIAEKPKSDSDNTLGNVNPNEVIPAIYNVLADKTAELKLYCPEEGINANTTINDVLGHMIVKINTNTTPDFFTQYLSKYSDHYALLSEASLATEDASPIFAGTFNKMDDKPMYWGSNMIGVSSGTDGYETNPNMTYYYHQAQLTTDDKISEGEYSKDVVSSTSGPTLQNRIDAIDDIITESKAIYESSSHNAWFQISTGGTITYERKDGWFDAYSANCDIHGKVANVLNTHLITKIQNKIQNNETSPLGIVLMNYCTTSSVEDLYWREVELGQTKNPQYKEVDTYGPELVSQIIELNRLFYLNRNKEAEEWPEGNPFLPQGASTSSVTKSTEGIVESTNVIIQTIQ